MTDSSASASMDWNDLASRQMPRLSGETTQYNRNLSQLQGASQSLFQGSSRSYGQQQQQQPTTTMPWNTGAGTATDTSQQQQLMTQTFAPPQQQQPHRIFESLEDALNRQEREIFESILSRTQAEIRASTDARIEAQLQASWDAERAVWSKELVGTRWLGGAVDSSRATTTSSATLLGSEHSPAQSTQLVTPSYAESTGEFLQSSADGSNLLDPAFVQAHLDTVAQMSKDRPLQDTIDQFSSLLTDTDNRASIRGYDSAWGLVQQLVAVSWNDSLSSPVQQAKAALSHFCRQFQLYVNSTVRQAALTGQDTSSSYQNDLTAQCEAFAKLKLGLLMDSSSSWPVVYYCLRCGDAAAAVEALPAAEPAVERCLAAMVEAQGDRTCIWDDESSPLRLDPNDRRTVTDLLESAKRAETPNFYQIGVYAFLSGGSSEPVSSETLEGFKTIEDYLTSALWNAVLQQNPVDELIRLGELIQGFGPTYFQDPASGGWTFALPLLASQQYQKALMWLAEAGGKMGLLQATHIGLVLSSAGIAVRNLGANDSVADGTVASLLVVYSSDLLSSPSFGALAALEYLVRIPNEVRARKEVAKLIANTGEIDSLVGMINDEGKRVGGAIADRYSASELAIILIEAADILSASKGDRRKTGDAIVCLMLAERYGDVLSLFNELLSPPNIRDKDRQYWIGQANMFHSQFISNRSHVLKVLEREDKTALIRTNRMLVDLNTFFGLLADRGSEEECWSIAENLRLLPVSASDRTIKETEYRGMDPLMKEAYAAFLVAVMELLCKEHGRLKRNLQGDLSGVVRERLQELQEKSRLYSSFAASVAISNEQIGKITELASFII